MIWLLVVPFYRFREETRTKITISPRINHLLQIFFAALMGTILILLYELSSVFHL